MVANESFLRLTTDRQVTFVEKMVRTYKEVVSGFSGKNLRRGLAATALAVGMAGTAGAQNFAAPVTAASGLTQEGFPIFHFADIDGDGDQDAFISLYDADYERFFGFQENTGTAAEAAFAPVDSNKFNLPGLNFNPTTIDLSDVDNDGDLDLFMGSYDFNTGNAPIYGWENTGTGTAPNFPLGVAANPFNFQPSASLSEVAFVDLDGDGDDDLLMNLAINEDTIEQFRYQENLGIMGTFPQYGPAQDNPFGLTNDALDRTIINTGDLDMDGDQDLVVGGTRYDEDAMNFYYYQNAGSATSPSFLPPTLNPFDLQLSEGVEILVPTFVDLDGDGDIDIISTVYDYIVGENSVLFWENEGGPASVTDANSVDRARVYPTTVENILNWEVETNATVNNGHLRVLDLTGRTLETNRIDLIGGPNRGTVNVADLPAGAFVVQLFDGAGRNLVSRRFFKQ